MVIIWGVIRQSTCRVPLATQLRYLWLTEDRLSFEAPAVALLIPTEYAKKPAGCSIGNALDSRSPHGPRCRSAPCSA